MIFCTTCALFFSEEPIMNVSEASHSQYEKRYKTTSNTLEF